MIVAKYVDSMSDSQKILSEPLKNIGAQDILAVGSTYEGVLRKRGGKFVEKLLHIGSVKWKQRFVVISQGCVYCFKDEYAHRPLSAFSLTVYESVHETTAPNMLNVFEIKHEYEAKPAHVFACETEAKRKLWIAHIEEALRQAHQHSGGSSQKHSADSDEGIAMTPSRKSRAFLPPLPPTPDEAGVKYKRKEKSEYSLESDDEPDDDKEPYDEIGEHTVQGRAVTSPKSKVPIGGVNVMGAAPPKSRQDSISKRPGIPLPDLPQSSGEQTTRSGYEKPPDCALKGGKLPDYINESMFKSEDFFFNSKDKIEAHRLLGSKPVGTFLVRLGSSTPTVLSVMTDLGIKEFQIAENAEGKVSINRQEYFPKLETMLCFYNQNDLPKKEYSVKLRKGYKS